MKASVFSAPFLAVTSRPLEKTHYNAPFAVPVTMLDGVEIPDPRIVPVSLRSLLLIR